MGLIDASTVAIDSTKLEAYEKSVSKKNINQDGRSADWGVKSDTNGNPVKWFGYKLHAVCEVSSGLPLAIHITPASTHDREAVDVLPKKCRENIKHKPNYYVMDAAYDGREIYELIHKEYHAQAIIPLNRRNAKQPQAGFCSAGYRMVYWGSSNGKNKFRCPHILRKCDCPCGSAWCSESNYGLVVKTSVKQDPRLFTVPHRGTKNWNKLYNLRTFSERCFARFKENLGLETGLKLGKYDKVTAHAYLCAITMYAAVIAVNQQYQNEEKLAV
ncbi:MAG: transposase [Syntrophomonadaceae bacterium]|nr:transposase [Syntrophomonadaceae bacterium]